MSDTSEKRLKVSREGVVLIKSFEGFRASAQPRPEGGWVIGYGHTRSARAGLTVSEPDAELLLQYDLIPVVATLNRRLPEGVNQHQFDALASYAFSIGLDRFEVSPVLERLEAGAADEAADAMVGSPEVAPPDAVLRRRAAERALFVAEAGAPVTLAQLMAAPLPLPVPLLGDADAKDFSASSPSSDEPAQEPAEPVVDAPVIADAFQDQTVAPAGSSDVEEPSPGASGEVPEPIAAADPAVDAIPVEPSANQEPAPDASPVAMDLLPAATLPVENADADAVAVLGASDHSATVPPVVDDAQSAQAGDGVAGTDLEAIEMAAPNVAVESTEPESEPAKDVADIQAETTSAAPEASTSAPIAASAAATMRLSPYAGVLVGPIPGLSGPLDSIGAPPSPSTPAVDTPPASPMAVGDPVVVREPETFDSPPGAETVAAPTLTLTPPEATEPPVLRPLWSEADRASPATQQSPLFEEVLQPAASTILRHEAETVVRRTPWSETGAFAAMGGIGLVSFGAAVAGFRKAAEGGVEGPQLSMVSWVLVLIALICVAVSGYNLFRVWTADRDAR